jgi:hypothetical protein
MMCSIRRGTLLGVLLAVGLALGAQSATEGTARAADKTELKAREAFAAGKYDDALELFAKLYAETLHPVYLRNIGRCYQKMQKPDQAIDKFREYLAKEKKVTPDEKAEIDGYIKEMEDLKAAQAKQAAAAQQPPPGPVTPVTNTPPPPANNTPPPNWTPPPATGPGPSATLVSQPPPAEKESHFYSSPWFWTGVGVVVIGGVVAAVLLSSGGTEKPACPSGVVGCK